MDTQLYTDIIRTICERAHVEPTTTIMRNITLYCKKLNLNKIYRDHPDRETFINTITESYFDSLKPLPKFDTQEYLHTTKHSIDKDVSTSWLQSNMPTVASKTMSIYFDTALRGIANDGTTITNFEFAMVPRTSNVYDNNGIIQTHVLPTHITYFKISSMTIPYSTTMRATNFAKEITLSFNALQTNGLISNNQTIHFVFKYTIISDSLVELTPVNPYCKFSPPLRQLDNVSLHMSDPTIPITFAMDRMIASSLNYLSTDGRITFSQAHNLTTGDVVIVQGLTTTNVGENVNVLSQIHNPRGLVITVINPLIIAIGIDFTTITNPDTSSKPTVVFYSKTFRFSMEVGHQDIDELN